jgi:hypothetical protein
LSETNKVVARRPLPAQWHRRHERSTCCRLFWNWSYL